MAVTAVIPVRAQTAIPAEQGKPETLRSTEKAFRDANRRAARLAREAQLSEKEIAALRQDLIAVASRARVRASKIENIESSLRDLTASESIKRSALDSRRKQLASLIAALQRFALNAPTALIAMPTPAAETIRSALLLQSTVPAVSERARELSEDLKSYSDVRSSLIRTRSQLDEERAAIDRERTVLAKLIAQKAQALRGARDEQKQAAAQADRLGREARNLRDLMARIEARRRNDLSRKPALPPAASTNFREDYRETAPPEAVAPASGSDQRKVAALPTARNGRERIILPRAGNLPVPGRIIGRFRSEKDGLQSDGITIRTIPGATVTASRGGRVVFSGPFKGLGKLLIIEHRGAYHLLLAGLERIDAVVGDTVLAGEPVGVMPATRAEAPTLYLELRRRGQPVNPTPWLASRRNRKNG
jgi:septal ring factor EnvC (AmiA/AmiB activator)